jgi:ribonuclease P protein component
MISKEHRFHGHGSLRFVYQRGETVRGPNGSLRYTPNKRRTKYRLAVVVSRKVNKSAVVRNRIRRRSYEAARLCLARLAEPYDLVLTVYNDRILELSPDDFQQGVCSYFERSGILPRQTATKEPKRAIIESKENKK